jgi:peptidoglycan/LPS O-acetylase OafA/YrhL
MDAIALGSFLAAVLRSGGMESVLALKSRTYILAPVAALIVLGCIAFHKQTIFNHGGPGQTIGYTAVAVLFFCVLLWTVTSPIDGLFNRFFSQKWLRFLGTYSYALYLCHMPIHRIMREYVYRPENFLMWHNSKMPGQIIFYVLCAVPTIIISLLSWHLIEKHFLSLKKYFPTKHPPQLKPAPSEVSQAQDSAAT